MAVLRATLLLVAVLALLPSASAAQTEVIPTGSRGSQGAAAERLSGQNALAGPRFGGDGIVWAAAGPRIRVMTTGPSGHRLVARVEGHDAVGGVRRSFALDAEGDRVALSTWAVVCDEDDEACGRYQQRPRERFAFFTGTTSTGLQKAILGCGTLRPILAGGALGTACHRAGSEHSVLVREADGTLRRYPGSFDLDIAGNFAAVQGPGRGVAVLRRDTGAEVLRVEGTMHWFELGPDGTLVYALASESSGDPGGVVRRVRPGAPDPVTLFSGIVYDGVLEGERLAVRSPGSAFGSSRFTVVTLDGEVVATHEANATEAGFDFDGRRLAYARRPCTEAQFHVWDVDAPTRDETGAVGCAPPLLAARRVRVGRDGLVRIPFRCDPAPLAACVGAVRPRFVWRDAAGRRFTRTGRRRVLSLDAAATATIVIRPRRRDLARARSAFVTLSRGSGEVVERVAVTLRR